MRHTRKRRAGSGVGQVIPRGGETEAQEEGGKKKENRSLTIKLRKRKPEKKVEWTSDTVDNEHMGRRSSKCCCIYEKPRAFGESSTESDEEEEEGCGHTHCVRGHRKGRRRATLGPTPTTPPQPPDPSQPPPGPMQH
ncbi:E3 ubiquitin-protein ligase PPP1R11 isoform X1 [Chlorocebus sabaeus]|uniref:E3 ubiquitin-protein ligase PPP1R11 isoform X1 n=1 Tax=Chlorocebus sabaeus TaxID=60711 RepID=UPI003BF9DF9E